MEPTVEDVMTARVVWVRKDASFRTMAAAFRDHRVSAFPVTLPDAQAQIGPISE